MLSIFIILKYGKNKKYYIILALLLVIGVLSLTYNTSTAVQARFSTEQQYIEDQNMDALGSVGNGRVGRWRNIWYIYSNKFTKYELIFGNSKTYAAHNQYLAILTSVGILGLILFIIIYFRFFIKLLTNHQKYNNIEYYYAIIVLIIMLSIAMVGHPFYYTTLLWYLMVLLSLSNTKLDTDL